MINRLIALWHERSIRVTEIAAVGWTDEGRVICERLLKMKPVAKDAFGHPVYRLRMDELATTGRDSFCGLRRLVDVYRG